MTELEVACKDLAVILVWRNWKVTSELFHCTTLCRTLVALTHFRTVPDASTCGLPVQLVVDSTWSRHVRFGALSSHLSSTGDLSMSPPTFLGLTKSSTVAPHWCSRVTWRPGGSWFEARSPSFPVLLWAVPDGIKTPAELFSASYLLVDCRDNTLSLLITTCRAEDASYSSWTLLFPASESSNHVQVSLICQLL